MGKMHKRLAKAINKSRQYGSEEDAEVLAAYLIARGWRDTEKRPRVQQVTVIPSPISVQQALQPGLTQLPDHRSLPVEYQKPQYVQ